MLHLLYSQLARSRRRYYQHRPHLRRRLTAPVISIGNLTVGGSGKTPLVLGQWGKGKKYKMELTIVNDETAKNIPTGGTIRLMA